MWRASDGEWKIVSLALALPSRQQLLLAVASRVEQEQVWLWKTQSPFWTCIKCTKRRCRMAVKCSTTSQCTDSRWYVTVLWVGESLLKPLRLMVVVRACRRVCALGCWALTAQVSE